nr:2-oxoglutarate dehydrogenase complex dihydrolipoyllysine-residue succinyltransferase [Pseudomonadota bacterium]
PQDGVLGDIVKKEGDTVLAQEILAKFTSGTASETKPATKSESASKEKPADKSAPAQAAGDLSPAVRRMVSEHNLDASKIKGTGKGGRVTKEDVEQSMAEPAAPKASAKIEQAVAGDRTEKRVPMSRLRAKIAERLVAAQHTAAMLTTFNEINMQPIMALRAKYKEQFEKRHNVKLGFMSFFVKAAIEALKRFPAVNASIDGNDVVYHGYFDIGIAVSTPRGLVVPVLRDADQMSMAEIEIAIGDFAARARDGKLSLEEMTGGTFTLTNGGVFGSMLSTPILNPPQSAILGMHRISDRAMVEQGQVVVLPMMYLALSYDHRIIDGRESVSFLVTIKELLEDPARMLLEL